MRASFNFPRFSDLQLGDYGKECGKGCLWAKLREVRRSADLNVEEWNRLWRTVEENLPDFDELTHSDCSNTSRNRRKAYNALVFATKAVLDVSIAP